MRTLLLFLHVLAAVLFIGPTTVASSRFAAHARQRQLPEAAAANRTTRIYGWATSVVGAVGVALAVRSSLFGEIWVDTALLLFLVSVAVLLAVHLPAQRRTLDLLWEGAEVPAALLVRLRASAGGYALLWVVVLWLMIAKPR
jgi:hypothetical protein